MRNKTVVPEHKVHLPVSVSVPDQPGMYGTTEYFSNREIRFALDRPCVLKVGSPVLLHVTLPPEITAGEEVFVRVQGRNRRIKYLTDARISRPTFTVTVKSFDFVRKETMHPARAARQSGMQMLAALAT